MGLTVLVQPLRSLLGDGHSRYCSSQLGHKLKRCNRHLLHCVASQPWVVDTIQHYSVRLRALLEVCGGIPKSELVDAPCLIVGAKLNDHRGALLPVKGVNVATYSTPTSDTSRVPNTKKRRYGLDANVVSQVVKFWGLVIIVYPSTGFGVLDWCNTSWWLAVDKPIRRSIRFLVFLPPTRVVPKNLR